MIKEKLNQDISTIERKVILLIKAHKELKAENEALKGENSRLKQQMTQKDQEIERFQNKIKISNLVSGIKAEERETSGLKDRISEYIKEIDQCIAYLSK